MKSLTQHFTSADAAPEDVIVAKVQRVLAGDDKLVQVFGAERIEAVPILLPDFANAPRLQVAHDFAPEQEWAPGRIDTRQVNVIVRIVLDWSQWTPLRRGLPTDPWPDWVVVSLATVETRILSVIAAAGHLVEEIEGEQLALAHHGPTIGSFATAGAEPLTNSTVGVFRDCRVGYTVQLDRATQRIRNIVAAEAA